MFELGKDLFDWVEVRGIRGEEEQPGACGPDCLTDGRGLVTAEIIQNDDVARAQGGDENLLDIGAECFAVDRPVNDPGSDDAVLAQGGHEGHGIPVPEGRATDQACATFGPAPERGHVGLRPGLINEHQPFQIDAALTRLPAGALAGDAGPLLLTGEQCFF